MQMLFGSVTILVNLAVAIVSLASQKLPRNTENFNLDEDSHVPYSVGARGVLWCGNRNGFAGGVPVSLYQKNEDDMNVRIGYVETNRRGYFQLDGVFKDTQMAYRRPFLKFSVDGKHCSGRDPLCTQVIQVAIPYQYIYANSTGVEDYFDLGVWNLQVRHVDMMDMCA